MDQVLPQMKTKRLTEISKRLRTGVWFPVRQIQDNMVTLVADLMASDEAITFLLKERKQLKKEIKRLQRELAVEI